MQRPESTEKKLIFYDQLVNDFHSFTEGEIRNFLKESADSPMARKAYYEEYWLDFFGKLMNEAQRIVNLHEKEVVDPERLRFDLQRISEDGLGELRAKMFDEPAR
jgi:hypothetical protein